MNDLTYGIAWTGLPVGGWYVIRQDGEIERFGIPYGTMPRRFKTPEQAQKAALRWYQRRHKGKP